MRQLALLACVVAAVVAVAGGCAPDRPRDGSVPKAYAPRDRLLRWDDADWQHVLDVAVTSDGLIQYRALTDDVGGARGALYRYVGRINQASPDSRPELFPTRGDRLAYWINAYNALGLYAVLERGLPDNVALAGVFDKAPHRVGGVALTLDDIDRRRVHPTGDVRAYFALCTLSRSSPPLRREAYSGSRLDAQLDDQGHRYLSDPRGAMPVSDGTVALSELFTRFHAVDFTESYARLTGVARPGLLEAVRPYAPADSPVRAARAYETMPYDWSLNRAP